MFSLLVKAMASANIQGAAQRSAAAKDAMRAAVQEAADKILQKGRADIAGAGNFGARWTEGLKANISESETEITLTVTEDVPYWTVFQNGKTIVGKPLLFFKPNKPPAGLAAGAPMPAVISKHSVTIPKKFHLVEIATEEAGKVPELFRRRLAQQKGSEE